MAITAVTAGTAAAPVVMIKIPKVLAKLKTVPSSPTTPNYFPLNKAMTSSMENTTTWLEKEKLRKVVEIPKGKIGTVPC
ncbi:MAG: hypothetical protein R3C99_10030 [Pirellulaceae bacterium]